MAKSRAAILLVVVVLAMFALVVVGTWILGPYLGIAGMLRSWQADLEAAGVPSRLAFGFVTIGGIPFVLASMRLKSKKHAWLEGIWPKSQAVSLLVVLAYMGGASIVVYALTAGKLVGKRYCPVDLAVFETARVCGDHSVPTDSISHSIAWVIREKRSGKDVTPKEMLVAPDGPFFDARTGFGVVFFGADMDGRLHAYSYPGVNPYDRSPLLEPGPSLRNRWRLQRRIEVHVADSIRVADSVRVADSMRVVRQHRPQEVYHSPYERLPLKELLGMVPMQPDNADLHYAVGMLLLKTHDRAGAERSFREALRADRGMKHARLRLQELGVTP